MAQTQPRIATLQAVQNITNSRKKITEEMEGSFQVLTVRGSGNTISVKDKEGNSVKSASDGSMLEKKIFNTICNSAVAVRNKRNQETLRAGYAAEKAGDVEGAAAHYNTYLNKTQVSFSILSGSALFGKVQDGDQIKGKIQKITTEHGSILTLDPKSLSIVAPGYGEDSSFDLSSMALAEAEVAPEESVATAQA